MRGYRLIAIRTHYLATKSGLVGDINASTYPDMQELLYVVDALMTDYSSSIWDFSFTYKPCFLYCPDLGDFRQERDFYSPIESWGFPLAQSEDELNDIIAKFNESNFRTNMDNHHKKNGSFEKGTATNDVARIIDALCYGDGNMPKDIEFV